MCQTIKAAKRTGLFGPSPRTGPRHHFSEAILRLGNAERTGERVSLLIDVIDASRNIGQDDDLLPIDVRQTLAEILEHYHLLAPLAPRSTPESFREARDTIEDLFF